ncbi:MAG: YcaO-related McrA-glycine thioamidation protein [Methanobacteriaceae archaeon]
MFSDVPVNYFECAYRSLDPNETIKRLEKKLKIAGITRITKISGLDRVGIPVYSAIRPSAQEGAVSIYAGKGASIEQAKASAMMEGFERYSAEKNKFDSDKNIISSYSQLENAINPEKLVLDKNLATSENLENLNIEWASSTDISTGEEVLVPENAVFHPFISETNNYLFKSNTNGLASGNIIEEAVLHGIFEVIERDAWSIFELTKSNKKQISVENTDNIENPLIKDILNKFKEAGIKIKLMDLTADIKIPTIAASADDNILKDPALLTLGVGTHLNPEIAVLRALTEVAQSRATQIHGTREDTVRAVFMRKAGYERMKKINKHYFEDYTSENCIGLTEIKNRSSNSFKKDINTCVKELNTNNIKNVLFTDLKREELGIDVVRVIIPEMEVYSVDSARIGERYKKFI